MRNAKAAKKFGVEALETIGESSQGKASKKKAANEEAGAARCPRNGTRPRALPSSRPCVVATACVPTPPPVENGRLPDSMLTTISPECRVATEIAWGLGDARGRKRTRCRFAPETSSY